MRLAAVCLFALAALAAPASAQAEDEVLVTVDQAGLVSSLDGNEQLIPLQPADPEEAIEVRVCNPEVYDFVFDYEVIQGLWASSAKCSQRLLELSQLQFGPPSAWELFNAVCKGPCRDYQNRADRLKLAEIRSNCTCQDLHLQCPIDSMRQVCKLTGVCRHQEEFWASTCAATACGRWETNEGSYQTARKECGFIADGALAIAPAAAVVVAVVGGALRNLWGGG